MDEPTITNKYQYGDGPWFDSYVEMADAYPGWIGAYQVGTFLEGDPLPTPMFWYQVLND